MRKNSVLILFVLWAAFLCPNALGAVSPVTILTDDFEAPDAMSNWTFISPDGASRIGIIEDPRNSSNHGMVLLYPFVGGQVRQNTVARSISISDFKEVRVSIDRYSFNNEVNGGLGFDGVSLVAGTVRRFFPATSAREQTFDLEVDPALYAEALRTGGILRIELQQFDDFFSPEDGLFFDNLRVTGVEQVTITPTPPSTLSEAAPFVLPVALRPVPALPSTLSLKQGTALLGTAIYPAGAVSAELTFPTFDNSLLDGDRDLTLVLSDGTFASAPFSIRILDDERPGLILILPATVIEGTTLSATVGSIVRLSSPLTIRLEVSDTTVATAPASLELPANTLTLPFNLQTIEDRRVKSDRLVKIIATAGELRVEKTIVVTERNSLVPVLTGPKVVEEGATEVRYNFSLDAISDEPLSVSFFTSSTAITFQPGTVTLPPGQSSGFIQVDVADDPIAQGDRPFSLTARLGLGLQSTLTGTIRDNDIAGFKLASPLRLAADVTHTLEVQAVNASGQLVPGFSGRADIYLVAKTGIETLLRSTLQFSSGKATLSAEFSYAQRGSRLKIVSSSGASTVSPPLVIFASLAFPATDLVYDWKRGRIYTSHGTNAAAGHARSISTILPATAQIGAVLALESQATVLGITSQQEYLYAVQTEPHSMRRIDLANFSLAEQLTPSSSSSRSFKATSLLTLPGRPRDFLATGRFSNELYTWGILMIDGTMASPQLISSALGVGKNPDIFYSYNPQFSDRRFTKFQFMGDTFQVVKDVEALLQGNFFVTDGDTIFSDIGAIFDGASMSPIGQMRLPAHWPFSWQEYNPTLMVPEVAKSRIYYSRNEAVAVYDTASLQLIAEVTFPGIGNIMRMVRWGDTGLAFVTSTGKLILVEDPQLVPHGQPTDLSLTASTSPTPPYLNEELTYSITVRNDSAVPAANVKVNLNLERQGHQLEPAQALPFAYVIAGKEITVDLDTIEPGATVNLRIVTRPTQLGVLPARAAVTTSTADLRPSNNFADSVLYPGFRTAPNSFHRINIPINGLAQHPVTGHILVCTAHDAHPSVRNKILAIDPLSGLITQSIVLPVTGFVLAISDDGSTAYVAGLPAGGAYKINLTLGAVEKYVPLVGDFDHIWDLAFLPGSRDSLLVSSANNGSRIFDNGVARPNGAAFATFVADRTMALSMDGILYGVTATGLVSQGSVPGLFQLRFPLLKADGNYVYSSDGRVIRTDTKAVVGNLAFGDYYPVEADRPRQRVYYAKYGSITSFDTESNLRVRTENFPDLINVGSLDRWGDDGLLAGLSSWGLAIIRSDLVPPFPTSIDLLISTPNDLVVHTPSLTLQGQAFHGQGILSVKSGPHSAITADSFAHWSMEVPNLQPGENLLSVTASSTGVPTETRTVTRRVFYAPHPNGDSPVPDSWLLEHFGSTTSANAALTSDPDGDGQRNLAEFLFVTNPNSPDRPQITLAESGPEQIRVSFKHRAVSNFQFSLETSEDLRIWTNIDVPPAFSTFPGPAGSMTTEYLLPASAQSKFFRIEATAR